MRTKSGVGPVALSLALSTALVVACAPANLATQQPVVLSGADPAPAAPEATFGTLTVTVRWPARSTQAIPDSTARVEIGVKDGNGILIAFASVTRNPGETSVTKLIKVRAGSGYAIDVKAYPAGTFSGLIVAQGSASGVSISSGATTNVPPISLTGTFVPTVGTVDQTFAVQGGSLVITGTNFQPNYLGSAKPTVKFAKSGGGTTTVAAADVTVDSPTQVTVIVPTDATSGDLTVIHDGIASTGLSATIVAPGTPVVSTFAGTGVAGADEGPVSAATFAGPTGIAIDPATGIVYVADTDNMTIRKIENGTVTTFATLDVPPMRLALSGGNLYATTGASGNLANRHAVMVMDLATPVPTLLAGGGGNGFVDDTGPAAKFNFPIGIAADGVGNLYVADTDNKRIRRITIPGAVVDTFAGTGASGDLDGARLSATFTQTYDIAIRPNGDMFVADRGNCRIRKISGGVVSTLAGTSCGHQDGIGADAQFSFVDGLSVTDDGVLFVTQDSSRIRRVETSTGSVTTFAAPSGNNGANDGLGDTATFASGRNGIAHYNGEVYYADAGNNKIRKIRALPAAGTFKVSAGNSTGAVYKVPGGVDLECRFRVLGSQTWSYDNGTTTFGAGGRSNFFATSAFTLNGGNQGGLIVKRGDNTYEVVGTDRTFVPASGEVLRFLMNDTPATYNDNTGSMTVTYSCGKVDAGNLNLTIQ